MEDNLFVVSRPGQLRNAQTLIMSLGAERNRLAILHTAMNPTLTRAIEANVNGELFEEVTYVQQPPNPTQQGRRKNRLIRRQIEELLEAAVEAGSRNLFLSNIDNYYSLFERIIDERKYPMELVLLEEGLGTYINGSAKAYRMRSVSDVRDVRNRAEQFGRALVRVLRSAMVLAAAVFSWIFRFDAAEFKNALEARCVPRRDRYGMIGHFDRAFVYFPEKLDQGALHVDQVCRLPFKIEQTWDAESLEVLGQGATLYVSQKYLAPDIYLPIIFDVLSELGESRVFFKFHPREDRAAFARAWERSLERHPRLEVVALDEIQKIPAEELLMSGRVSRLIGLTSTVLMYAEAFFEQVEVTSVASRFQEIAESPEYGVSRRQLAEFDRDREAFVDVSSVRQF